MRLGILASHQGTNFQAIIDACQSGNLDAEVAVAISNNSKSRALARARLANIPTVHLSSKTHPQRDELDKALLSTLRDHQVDLVVTVGYMKKLGPQTLQYFQGRIINIHPALLPKHGGEGMFGMEVHKAVLESEDAETGVTVHYVDGNYDTGQIISQTRIQVMPDDTPESLAARVLAEEHKLLVNTLKQLTETPCNHQMKVR
ncbi:MAG: phosphoribosylglycinamide formyltransferase [Gammaproteobacteria bacterium]|nr:phosphoribosylglycinamide formyltransferase [Gammaproteobacteria bacterium]